MSGYTGTDVGRWSERPADALVDAFYPLTRRLFDEDEQFVIDVERKLAEARMDETVELYLSKALAFGVLSGLVLWLLGIAVGLFLSTTGVFEVSPNVDSLAAVAPTVYVPIPVDVPWETLVAIATAAKTPALILVSGVVFGSIGFATVFGAFVALPYSRAGRRRREIDMVLPDAVSFMYALSVGGMSQLEIIEAVAHAEDTYGEVSREFRTILQETRYFDTDYRSAIQRRASRTPSTELSQFLTDMLSIIDSGGNMKDFLDDKKDLHFRTAKEQQQRNLDTLELFSEMYITLSLFPLLLLIVLVITALMGGTQDLLFYLTVYVLIPFLGATFLLLVATIKQDEVGDGYLQVGDEGPRFDAGSESGPFDLGFVREFTGTYYLFDRIKRREGTFRVKQFLRRPDLFFRENPLYTLAITVPLSLVIVLLAVFSGVAPRSWAGALDQPVWSTFVYVYLPVFLVGVPLALFWELNVRSRRAILDGLSGNLRKLASANATGLTLLESVKVVSETTPGKLGEEFGVMYDKSTYGMHLNESLVVFNNKYRIPRLARTVKLVSKAHEISGEISSVLSTAARATEAQEDIERERISHARIQVAIIVLTFLTLLGVMAVMKVQFIDVMAELAQEADGGAGAGHGFGGSIDVDQLSLLFFHAVTLQAILSGLVCGYIRSASLASGVKYVVALSAITLGVWVGVA